VETMIQSYMEETDDMLQKAEECIMRLEIEYSSVDVNELFRIAHTIKGSSYMVEYEDIGNLMHKIEDMLDCVRNDSILFGQSIVSLCFEGFDTVKKMLLYKKEQCSPEIMERIVNSSSRIIEMIESFIKENKKELEKTVPEQSETGMISSRLNKDPKGKNKYYITFFIEEDAPMVSPLLVMILGCVDDIGVLAYSSIGDDYFFASLCDNSIRTFNIILFTDVDEAELYTYFALFYVEKINIVDLSRKNVEENDYSFIDTDDNLYATILKASMKLYKIAFNLSEECKISSEDIGIMGILYDQAINAFGKMKSKTTTEDFIVDFNELYRHMIAIYNGQVDVDQKLCLDIQEQVVKRLEKTYQDTKGKHIFSIFKSEEDNFIKQLQNFVSMMNKSSTLIFLIDVSKLTILHENEVKELIQIKRQLESKGIEIGVVTEGPNARRIINIFDSIKQVEEFHVFHSQLDTVLGIFNSENSCHRICEKLEQQNQ